MYINDRNYYVYIIYIFGGFHRFTKSYVEIDDIIIYLIFFEGF